MNGTTNRTNPLRLAQTAGTLLSIAAFLAGAGSAYAGPENGQVVAGTGSIATNGSNTVIHAGDKSVFHWQQFNIGAGESVKFIQPSSTAKVLNRITGPDPSTIAGSLTANGIVYIVNPAGVYFANGAMVNVGGLYAAAGSISNADFLSGADKFTGLKGTVENRGTITGSAINLIGQRVANYGAIVAPQGMVAMAAGEEVYIGKQNGQIFAKVSVDTPSAGGTGITQAGTINAEGGRITLGAGDMYAVAIHHTGASKARDITVQGGSKSTVRVSGTLDASNQGADNTGGTIHVLGDRVAIEKATVNASGVRGGGEILIGGEYQGKGDTQTASRTLITRGSTLNAEATHTGDGGRIIVWSDHTTVYRGELSVRGGAQAGDGGFAEVSGKENLLFAGGAQTHSRSGGADGTLLLDPRDITIQAGTGPDDNEVLDSQIFFGDGGASTDFVIGTDTLEALTGNILLQAQRDIFLNAALNLVNQTAGESVTFRAGNDININAPLSTAGAIITLRANDAASGVATGNGLINITAAINSDGGNINLFGAGIDLDADVSGGTGVVNFNAPVILTENVTVAGGSVTFHSTIESEVGETNDLTVNAGATSFRGDIGAAGPGSELGVLTTDAAGQTAVDASQIVAETVNFGDQLILQSDLAITATTGASFAAINSVTDQNFDLSIDSPDITLAGNVGAGAGGRLGTLETTAGDVLRIDAEQLSAERFTLRGPVIIDRDTTLSATQAMTFVAPIDSASGESNALTLSGGAMSLTGDIGQADALSRFETTSGTLFLDTGNLTAQEVVLGTTTRLGADAVINASGSASIGVIGSREGETFDLTVNSPDTTFTDSGKGENVTPLGILTTDADGITTLRGAALSADEIRFEDAVLAIGDNVLTGDSIVRFAKTVNSGDDTDADQITVNAPSTVFVGAIGNENPLTINTDEPGTTIFGSGTVNLTGGDFLDTVLINNDTTITGERTVRFLGAVNSQANEENTLTLDGAFFLFTGGIGIGINGQLGSITSSATTSLGGTVNTSGDQNYSGAVLINDAATINAANVVFGGTVNSATVIQDEALTINTTGGGLTRFEGNVGVLNPLASITTNTDGRTEIAAGSMFTSANITFGDVVLLDAPTVTISGGNVRFDQTVNSMNGPRTLNVNTAGSGTTTFAGAVGASGILQSLATNPDGTTRIGGGQINTLGAIALNDNVVLENDTLLVGSSVALGRAVDSGGEPRTLTIRPAADGTTTFGGIVGGTSPLGSITVAPQITMPTSGTIQFFGNSVRTVGDQLYNQRGILGSNITFVGTNVSFVQGLDSTALLEPAALTVNTSANGITRLFGPIGQQNALRSITTNADGRTIIGNSQGAPGNNSAITTTERITFNDDVIIRNNIVIEGRGGIAFFDTLNAAQGDATGPDVTLLTDITGPGTVGSPTAPRITFSGDVGGETPLGSLTLGENLAFIPAVATIGAGLNASNAPISNYSLAINTRRGFVMGENQKMTVLGDLLIDAGAAAILSDINTLGQLDVNAPEIVIRQRGETQVIAGGGASLTSVNDPGVDFVAGEGINFSVAPSVTGAGNPPRFGTPDGDNISSNLEEFSSRTIGDVTAARLRSGGNYLDVVAAGPANITLATALPTAVPPIFLAPDMPEESAEASSQARDELADIGIPTRDPSLPEAALPAGPAGPRLSPERAALLGYLTGPELYIDVQPTTPAGGRTAVTISRLPADVVDRVLASYRTIFLREAVDPATGERTPVSNTQQISQTLTNAWNDYAALAGARADAVGFRAFVEAVPEQAEALYYLNGLRRLFTEIGYLGLTTAEARRARDVILEAVEVPGMTQEQLEAAIVTQQLGSPR